MKTTPWLKRLVYFLAFVWVVYFFLAKQQEGELLAQVTQEAPRIPEKGLTGDPARLYEPYISKHHPRSDISSTPSRNLPTDNFAMGNVTMQCMHAFFVQYNITPRGVENLIDLLKSTHFKPTELTTAQEYKENLKLFSDKAVK
jgi:hypothetical protein